MKLKLSGDWKGLMLAHGEKVGVALIAVGVLVLVWKGLGREGLEPVQYPGEITKLASDAQEHIAKFKWAAYPEKDHVKPLNLDRALTHDEVDPDIYKLVTPPDPPLLERKDKRGDPQWFPVAELEVHAGFGPFAMQVDPAAGRIAAPPGAAPGGGGALGAAPPQGKPLPQGVELGGVKANRGARVVGRRWIVINGLVPVAKQTQEFVGVFAEAEDYQPARDVPQYLGYYVERAEETGSATLEWKMLQTVSANAIQDLTSDWVMHAPEIVDGRFSHKILTYPLGPLLLKDWDASVTHSKVPFASKKEAEAAQPPPAEAVEPEAGQFDFLGGFNQANKPQEPAAAKSRQDQKPAPYALLRFFDFTVAPGKQYRYRVRLVSREPNVEVDSKFLQKAVIERLRANTRMKSFAMTDWSEPSPAIEVPLEDRLLAASANPTSRSYYDEPSVQVLVKSFDVRTGLEAMSEFKMARGSVANLEQSAIAIQPAEHLVVPIAKHAFQTEAVLADIRGLQEFPKPNSGLSEPTELLLLDAAGKLVVRTEHGDRSEVDFYRQLNRKEEKPAVAPGGAPAGNFGLPPGAGLGLPIPPPPPPPVRRGR